MDMAKLLSLFKDEDDTPKASSCDMCGGDHGLDEECVMDEDAQDFADYDKNIRAKRFDKKQSGRGSEEYLNRQANRDKAERIAMLKRRIARAKIEARSGGNPHAKKRLRDFQEELKQLMGAVEEGFEDATTEPDPEYSDTKYMTKDLAGGLNKEKRSFRPTAGADNPMALEDDDLLENKIRAELKALYKL